MLLISLLPRPIARPVRNAVRRSGRFLRRITPLTWCIWLALVSDLAAPGYLVFNLGVTKVDATVIAEELIIAWEVITDAPSP
ncbi:MAG: hypothetical protein WBA43_04295 [Elainellaceae cyanobacterium]